MSEPVIATLGQLIAATKKNGILPTKFGGKDFFTLVVRDGKCWLEPTSMDDYARAKAASPRKGG